MHVSDRYLRNQQLTTLLTAPVETLMFGLVHQNAASGAKSAIYDCLVAVFDPATSCFILAPWPHSVKHEIIDKTGST